MTELTSRTIADLRDGFRSGEFSAREIARPSRLVGCVGRGKRVVWGFDRIGV